MDNKVLIDADCKYADSVDGGRSIFGKELLENETMMDEFIKSFENDAALKVVCYYKSSDDKRRLMGVVGHELKHFFFFFIRYKNKHKIVKLQNDMITAL